MKIAFITTYFLESTVPLMKHMGMLGYETDLFLFCYQGGVGQPTYEYDKPFKGNKIIKQNKHHVIYQYLQKESNIYQVPFYSPSKRRFLHYIKSKIAEQIVFRNLFKMLDAYDVIYVIVNEPHDAKLCKKLKAEGYNHVIVAYHEVVDNHIGEKNLKQVVKETVSLGYPIVTFSNHTQKELCEISGNNNINTIYFGPFETYKLYSSSKPIIKQQYILFIGMIRPYKGLSFLYNTICNQNINKSYKIVVAGYGQDPVLDKIKKDERFVVINKFLNSQEFINLVQYATCVVCPYVSGSQSGITQTAMVYGIPVVATNVGAFSEFIEEGKNGYLVEYGNEEDLGAAICKITEEHKYLENYIPKHLNWKMNSGILDQLIKNVLRS